MKISRYINGGLTISVDGHFEDAYEILKEQLNITKKNVDLGAKIGDRNFKIHKKRLAALEKAIKNLEDFCNADKNTK